MSISSLTWDDLRAGPYRIHAVSSLNSSILRNSGSLYGVPASEFHDWIRAMHAQLIQDLAEVGIDYDGIARALVPHPGRREIALLFDWVVASEDSNGFYGRHLARTWIPALPRPARNKGLNAILHGDIIAHSDVRLRETVLGEVDLRTPDSIHLNRIYAVYITNLSSPQKASLVEAASSNRAFVGYADCTSHSPLKEHLAVSLPQLGLRVGSMILDGVDDDAPNPLGYPFVDGGLTPVGIRSDLYLPFLTFRINTHLTGRNFSDSDLAFRALDPRATAVELPSIWMTEGRYAYLHKAAHHGALALAELAELDRCNLEDVLSELCSDGFMYNLRYQRYENTGDEVLMYDCRIEVPTSNGPRNFTVALKYDPLSCRSELVTFI